MNLGRARAVIRPLLTLENEYRVRSLTSALVPGQRTSVRRGYHFCNWKTGSQWVRLVLSDPRFQRHSGLTARLHQNGLGQAPEVVSKQFPRTGHFIATPLFAGSDHLETMGATEADRAIFVTRHPRDLLVSFYFTNLENHPLNADVAVRRRQLETLSTEDGLLQTLDHGFDEMIRIGDSWSNPGDPEHRCPVRIIHYETLCAGQAEAAWADLLQHIAGKEVDTTLVRRLLATYSADNMRGPSSSASKLRDRTTAGWEHHFTDRVESEFTSRYADVEQRWGYANPNTYDPNTYETSLR